MIRVVEEMMLKFKVIDCPALPSSGSNSGRLVIHRGAFGDRSSGRT
jgi:hypothetical protein